MADEVLIAQFRADVDGVKTQLDSYVKGLEKVQKEEKDTQKTTQETARSSEEALKKRNALIRTEVSELKKLQDARKRAFTPESIDQFNRKIGETKARIASLRGETTGLGTSIKSTLAGVAAGFAAAFSVQTVINFTKASVDAFLEAEENASRLKFAITAIGGESEVAFNRLIKQSEQLSQITVFSDDAIQQAQAALAAFGLTSDEIEKLIPSLADFATITSQDIPAAAQQIGAALEGNGREFKKYGIEVSATATRTENLSSIMKGLATQTGAAEEAAKTLGGQLKTMENQVGELEESIGSRLAGSFVELRRNALLAFEAILKGFDSVEAKRLLAGKRQRELIEARVEANLAGDAAVSGLTEQAEAERQLLETGEQLNKLAKERQAANAKLQEEKGKLFNLEEREAAQAIVDSLEKQRQELIQQAGVLKETIELKKNDAAAAKKVNEELTEGQKKAAEDAEKLRKQQADDLAKNLALLRKLQIDNMEDEKNQRIAQFEDETKSLTAKGELRAQIIKEMEIDLVRDLNKIDEQRNIDPLFRVPELTNGGPPDQLTPKTLTETPDQKAQRDITDRQQAIKDLLDEWVDANAQMLADSQALVNELVSLFGQLTEKRVEQIERVRDTEIEAIDARLEKSEADFNKRRVSEKDFERTQEELLKKRQEAEKKAAAETQRLKRRQFNIEKVATLAQIAIETALKAIETYPLSALVIAYGAVQAGIVAAQPNPYKKGTKGSKAGLSLVGEEGPELMMLPQGAKIAPARQTKKYAKVIDSMMDNTFDQMYSLNDITHRLAGQKRQRDDEDKRSLAENITRSMVINQISNAKSDFYLERIAKSGIIIRNIDDLKQDRISPYR